MPERAFHGRFLRWLNRSERTLWASDPAAYDPKAAEGTVRLLDRFFGPHRPYEVRVSGFERLPDSPVLLVSNHSGGTTIPDAWGFAWAWYRHFGFERPLHFLAHEWVLPLRRIGVGLARRGVLWADHDVALQTLRDLRRDVVVFPGGDLDTWRPYRRRYEVEFGGRTGYARLALEAGVPVVPLANAGAHETLRVLTDGRQLAHWLGLDRLARAHVFPVHLSLPWGLAVGPWPHLPWPRHFRYRVGEPIVSGPHALPPSPGEVAALDRCVRAAVQTELDALARGRHVKGPAHAEA